ncbi:hypothetical protein [Tenacibaculum sp. M341]|uniref:hypothetical protein n=1 Tax=Tenacibaculum sp. M341 TaxID=2530339 RepID=UPI001043B2FE|nr:hypothetical protein [Tenacibaculum sp. M341]TCI92730.1 hypothetical protein EYW44_07490 [Tenacibaculum sp. M341]
MAVKAKKYFNQFIKEIIPVIVGILIALFINNWAETRKEKKYIEKIFSTISKELLETKEDIVKKTAQQNRLIDSLSANMNNKNKSLFNVVYEAGGISLPHIRVSTWKAVSNSKIELVNYEKIAVLADIEGLKELLHLKLEKVLDLIYSGMYSVDYKEKEILKIMMHDVIGTQKSILKDIEKFQAIDS